MRTNNKSGTLLSRIYEYLKKFEIGLLVVMFTIIFVVCVLQIVSRYVFNNPIVWTNEFSGMLEMVVTMLALGFCVRTKSNITVNEIYNRFPPNVQHMVTIITNILCIFVLYQFGKVGWSYSMMQWTIKYGTFGVYKGITDLAVPLGCLLASINLAFDCFDHILMLIGKSPVFKFKKEEE